MGEEINPAADPAGLESGTLFQRVVIPEIAQQLSGSETCLFSLGILGPGLRLRRNRDDDKLCPHIGRGTPDWSHSRV